MPTKPMDTYRSFLKDTIRQDIDFAQTDQGRGIAAPPIEKPPPPGVERIRLPPPDQFSGLPKIDLLTAIRNRRSVREFGKQALTLKELSFLLWCTQGIRKRVMNTATFRTVPSAGARHALETYLYVRLVEDLTEGIYRYLPVEHELIVEYRMEAMAELVAEACLGQAFVGQAAATWIWTTIPYRMEWRYDRAAHKVIALDAGHVCQNLYLACEAIGAGTCAIAAYSQDTMDRLLRLDGREEFVVYLAPVGKK